MPKKQPTVRQSQHKMSEADKIALGAVIRAKREKTGVTLCAFAKTLGISSPGLSRIELGKREPSLALLRVIHQHLPLTGPLARYLTTGEF